MEDDVDPLTCPADGVWPGEVADDQLGSFGDSLRLPGRKVVENDNLDVFGKQGPRDRRSNETCPTCY
jgi:hypothetical protein